MPRSIAPAAAPAPRQYRYGEEESDTEEEDDDANKTDGIHTLVMRHCRPSPESTGDVVLSLRISGIREQSGGVIHFNETTRFANFGEVEEGGLV